MAPKPAQRPALAFFGSALAERARRSTLFDDAMERAEAMWARHRRRLESIRLGDSAAALEPMHGVRRVGARFESECDDPQLRVASRRRGAGYYLLYVHVVAPREGAFAKLYVDRGDGYDEDLAFGLTVHPTRPVFRIVRLTRPVKRLRFDPAEEPGPFEVRAFRFHRVPAAFARRRMLRRLALQHPQLKGRGPAEIRAHVADEARETRRSFDDVLVDLYDRTFVPRPRRPDYVAWQSLVEAPAEAAIRADRDAILASLPARPRISVLVATRETEAAHLDACIESVRAQTYPDWELCIADDASTKPHVREVLERHARDDARIRTIYRSSSGSVCRAINDALALATGDFVALLDPDDVLASNALLHVARSLAEHPGAALVYGDHDKLRADGRRESPHFKPRFNPELLLAQNYIGHLFVARTDRVRALGGLRAGFEGSHDHDLLLRITEGLALDAIVHVPRILHHAREAPNRADAEADAAAAGRRAVADALARRGCAANVDPVPDVPHGYRVRWELPERAPLVSLVVPTRDAVDLLSTCVDSILRKTTYPRFEVLVVDNGSKEPATLAYLATLEADPRVRVLRYDAPFNYSAINNFAVRHAHGAVVGLVNNDVEVIHGDWLTEMIGHAIRPEIGCVGAKLLYPNDTVQHAGVIIGLGGVAGHSHRHFRKDHPGYFHRLRLAHALSAVTAACLIVRKSVFDEVGGLDTSLAVAFNDVDFCLRVREAGYRNVFTPHAELYHHESATRGHDTSPEKAARFQDEFARMQSRWGDALLRDPYYSPHLTLDFEDFSIGLRA